MKRHSISEIWISIYPYFKFNYVHLVLTKLADKSYDNVTFRWGDYIPEHWNRKQPIWSGCYGISISVHVYAMVVMMTPNGVT